MNILVRYKTLIHLLWFAGIPGVAHADALKAHIDPDSGVITKKPLVTNVPAEAKSATLVHTIQKKELSQHTLPDGTVILTGGPIMSSIHANIDKEGKVTITHNRTQSIENAHQQQ